jgi:hypothetical protein
VNALQDPAENQPSELQMLKARADMMGVVYSNNIGLDTLRKKIEDKMNGVSDEPVQAAAAAEQAQPAAEVIHPANPLVGETKPAARKSLRQHLVDEQMKLVRLRIQCLDPKKANLPGEIFTVANEHLGTVKKFVPYGEATDGGYHVPYIIYTMLEARRFLNIRTVKDKRTGVTTPVSTWAKEFAIEVLPLLTKEELARLATAQLAAGSLEVQTA